MTTTTKTNPPTQERLIKAIDDLYDLDREAREQGDLEPVAREDYQLGDAEYATIREAFGAPSGDESDAFGRAIYAAEQAWHEEAKKTASLKLERILAELDDCYRCMLDAGTDEDREEMATAWTPTAIDVESVMDCVPCNESEVIDVLKIWRRKTGVRVAQ